MTEFRRWKVSGTGSSSCLEFFFLFCTLNREGARAVNVAKWHKQSPNVGDSDNFYIVYDCLENHQTASGSHNRVVTLLRIVVTEAFEVFSAIIFLRNPSGALYCDLSYQRYLVIPNVG